MGRNTGKRQYSLIQLIVDVRESLEEGEWGVR